MGVLEIRVVYYSIKIIKIMALNTLNEPNVLNEPNTLNEPNLLKIYQYYQIYTEYIPKIYQKYTSNFSKDICKKML
jgi:hypothetical protein